MKIGKLPKKTGKVKKNNQEAGSETIKINRSESEAKESLDAKNGSEKANVEIVGSSKMAYAAMHQTLPNYSDEHKSYINIGNQSQGALWNGYPSSSQIPINNYSGFNESELPDLNPNPYNSTTVLKDSTDSLPDLSNIPSQLSIKELGDLPDISSVNLSGLTVRKLEESPDQIKKPLFKKVISNSPPAFQNAENQHYDTIKFPSPNSEYDLNRYSTAPIARNNEEQFYPNPTILNTDSISRIGIKNEIDDRENQLKKPKKLKKIENNPIENQEEFLECEICENILENIYFIPKVCCNNKICAICQSYSEMYTNCMKCRSVLDKEAISKVCEVRKNSMLKF